MANKWPTSDALGILFPALRESGFKCTRETFNTVREHGAQIIGKPGRPLLSDDKQQQIIRLSIKNSTPSPEWARGRWGEKYGSRYITVPWSHFEREIAEKVGCSIASVRRYHDSRVVKARRVTDICPKCNLLTTVNRRIFAELNAIDTDKAVLRRIKTR